METLTLFYLRFCPYCRNAKRALAQLAEEEKRYADLAIRWVDEAEDRALADRYDYYYVPSLFAGERKLYEAEPGESYEACKARLKAALGEVLFHRAVLLDIDCRYRNGRMLPFII